MSDDSDNSESYVVINPGDSANGRESIDATLFAVNASSRASPVEVGLEVTEETSPSGSIRSNVDRLFDSASVSASASMKRDVAGGMKKDGKVGQLLCSVSVSWPRLDPKVSNSRHKKYSLTCYIFHGI